MNRLLARGNVWIANLEMEVGGVYRGMNRGTSARC